MKSIDTVKPMSQTAGRTLLLTYVSGFGLSIILTIIAYLLTTHHNRNGNALIAGLLGLAVVQFIVQLVFFLHIGHETRPRWKLAVLLLMISVVLIVVLGSIWVMYSLNYRMSPERMQQYLQAQDGGI